MMRPYPLQQASGGSDPELEGRVAAVEATTAALTETTEWFESPGFVMGWVDVDLTRTLSEQGYSSGAFEITYQGTPTVVTLNLDAPFTEMLWELEVDIQLAFPGSAVYIALVGQRLGVEVLADSSGEVSFETGYGVGNEALGLVGDYVTATRSTDPRPVTRGSEVDVSGSSLESTINRLTRKTDSAFSQMNSAVRASQTEVYTEGYAFGRKVLSTGQTLADLGIAPGDVEVSITTPDGDTSATIPISGATLVIDALYEIAAGITAAFNGDANLDCLGTVPADRGVPVFSLYSGSTGRFAFQVLYDALAEALGVEQLHVEVTGGVLEMVGAGRVAAGTKALDRVLYEQRQRNDALEAIVEDLSARLAVLEAAA